VWCAAGKGTFGTAEVVNRVRATRLEEVVSHRNLILPQLSATGVAAHEVKKLSGFKVTYGPIRSDDIPAFIDAGMVATPEMRRVRFGLADRLILAPNDIMQWFKYIALMMLVFFALSGIDRNGYSAGTLLSVGPRAAANLMIAYLGANILGPVLLPWLPGRAFALKGFVLGFLLFLLSYAVGLGGANFIESAGWALIMSAVSSFIVMNFTGSSTYTSLTGVRREMVYAVPFQAVFVILGVALWMIARFI
jgi:acetyl-CoA decarbonylase/synthase complex subunit gamma